MTDFKNMTESERLVFAAIKQATIDQLKPRREIEKATGLSKRKIEQTILRLRQVYQIPVYALKRYPHSGYFIARNEEERQAGIRAYAQQINTSQKILAVMREIDIEAFWERA